MTGYLILVGLIALYALAASRLEYLLITGPIVFVVVGFVLGTRGLGVVELGTGSEIVRVVTGVTLALLLFSDASSVGLRALRREASVVGLLLLIGLPLAIIFGAGAAYLLMPSLGLAACALLACILAPTDLSLGLAMFKNPLVPERVRREINVESGLNDGIAAPLVTLLIGVTIAEMGHMEHPIAEAVVEIAIGLGLGAVVGAAGGVLMRLSSKHGWSSAASRQFAALAFALLAYGAAVALHGNGFIAAFVAGIVFGTVYHKGATEAVALSEKTGTLLTLGVWFVFGATVAPLLISDGLRWEPVLYAVLSLTAVRMLAVAAALLGKKFHRSSVLFIGWFGPRGLASVAFLILALQALREAGIDVSLFAATAGWTILLSVILHGLSAGPVAAWYGKKSAGFATGSPELAETGPVQTRHGLASPTTHSAE